MSVPSTSMMSSRAGGRAVAREIRRILLAAGVAAAALQAPHAWAQSESGEEQVLDEVQVTGSRIIRRDYAAPSPIVTLEAERLDDTAGGTFGIKLQWMPQVTPSANEMTGSGQPTGRASIDLRGLGPNRTLVLADGRRLQPSQANMVVDLNTVPLAMIENIEVITGGASAVYGADAVAGVVNMRLKKNFQGVEISGKYNIAEVGDAEEYVGDILVGGNFAEGRGNVVLGLGYLNRGKAYFTNRKFYTDAFPLGAAPYGSSQLPEGTYIPGTNSPDPAVWNDLFASYGFSTLPVGVGPGSVLGFNEDGTLYTRNAGVNWKGENGDYWVLSPVQNSVAYNLGNYQIMTAPTERYTVFSRGRFDFTDSLSGFAQVMFTKYTAVTNYGAGLQTQRTTAVVPVDNYFIPDDLRVLLASRPDPTAPFQMEKLWTATGTSVLEYKNNIYQFTAGLEGRFGNSGWTWDISGSTGVSDLATDQTSGGASYSRIQALLNSRSVEVDGQLVNVPQYITSPIGGVAAGDTYILNPAYLTATNDGGRSLPGFLGSPPPCPEGLNMFGITELSDSCREFLQIHPKSFTKLEQNIVEANVQGTLFQLPAGALQAALGVSYRDIDYENSPSPANADMVGSFGSNPASGYDSVKEIYGELLVPVLRGLPLVNKLELGLGYRYSDHSFGGVNTYKVDMDWQMVDSLRLRGGIQRAIRAPNVTELYAPTGLGFASLGRQDPCNADSPERTGPNAAAYRQLCIDQGVPVAIVDSFNNSFTSLQTITGGNPNLKPEKADTVTIGTVWSPSFDSELFSRFTASVDYYSIKMKDTIGSTQGQLIFQGCFDTITNAALSNNTEYCQAIVRNPVTGNADQVRTPTFNLGGLKASGIDLQVDWSFPLSAVGLPEGAGRLAINSVLTRTLNFQSKANDFADWSQDYTGTYGFNLAFANNGARPAWKANTNFGWSRGLASASLNWYYVGKMRDLTVGPAWAPVNNMKPYHRFDLAGGYQLNEHLRLSGGVTNLLDKRPIATSGGIPGNTDSGTYDTLGRRYFAGFNLRF